MKTIIEIARGKNAVQYVVETDLFNLVVARLTEYRLSGSSFARPVFAAIQDTQDSVPGRRFQWFGSQPKSKYKIDLTVTGTPQPPVGKRLVDLQRKP